MLARQTFKTSPEGSHDLLVCLHPESQTLMVWLGTANLSDPPTAVIRGEELARLQRWITDPEFKG